MIQPALSLRELNARPQVLREFEEVFEPYSSSLNMAIKIHHQTWVRSSYTERICLTGSKIETHTQGPKISTPISGKE